MILLDSNVILRLLDPVHPHHEAAKSAVSEWHRRGESLAVVPQTLYEFWVVATRPKEVNGLGLSVAATQQELASLRQATVFLPDPPGLYAQWESLVVTHQCVGKIAHDARLAAAMMLSGIDRLLTFNAADFRRFPNIELIDPAMTCPRIKSQSAPRRCG